MAHTGEATVKVGIEWNQPELAGLALAMDQAAPIVIGRVVHYQSRGSADGVYDPQCVAAIVTGVADSGDYLGLAVLNPSGLFFHTSLPYEPSGEHGGTWHRISDDFA
jgi:hypothetical protein